MKIQKAPNESKNNFENKYIFNIILSKNKIPINLTDLTISLLILKLGSEVVIDSAHIVITDAIHGKITITLSDLNILSIGNCKTQILLVNNKNKKIKFPEFTINSIINNTIKQNNVVSQVDVSHQCEHDYIRNIQRKVVDTSTNNTIQFAFVTDLHADDYKNYYDQIVKHLNAVINIESYGILDFITIGGDIHSGVYKNKGNPKSKLSEIAKILRVSKTPVFVLHGNHDDNSYTVVSPKNPVLSNLITKKEWFNRMIKPFMNGEIHDSKDSMSLYYYKDFYDKKIRVICLDSSDYPIIKNKDNTLKWYGQNFYGFGSKQVLWLQSEALNTLDKNDWSVIILSHMATRDKDLMYNGSNPYNGVLVEGVLKSFMNGDEFSATTSGDYGLSINANFKSQGPRKILCYVYGHTHTDNINKPVDLGWNFINTASCYSSGIKERTLGTNKEDLWDVIVADKITGVIDCFRYGYGVDRHIL